MGLCSCSQEASGGISRIEAAEEKVPQKAANSSDSGQFLAAPQVEGEAFLPTKQYSYDLDTNQCLMAESYRMPVYSREGICDPWN